MPLYALILLALVQGITEFLPISSSGHLALTWDVFDKAGSVVIQDQAIRLDYDIAVHVGSLLAVCWYLRTEILSILRDFIEAIRTRSQTSGLVLGFYIGVATLPVVIVGFFARDIVETSLRNIEIIAWATLLFGIVLYIADRRKKHEVTLSQVNFLSALFIGFSQVLALIPGTSRSGITMTAGRFLGFTRVDAARFSLLLSIPTILSAGLSATLELSQHDSMQLGYDAILAAIIAFCVAFIAIVIMMRWLKSASFTPFVLYRIGLGAILLSWVYFL